MELANQKNNYSLIITLSFLSSNPCKLGKLNVEMITFRKRSKRPVKFSTQYLNGEQHVGEKNLFHNSPFLII